MKSFNEQRGFFCSAVISPTLSNVVRQKVSLNSLWLKSKRENKIKGAIWRMWCVEKKTPFKIRTKQIENNIHLEKIGGSFIKKKKTLWRVFSPMCLIYIYSQRSKRLLVWENRQSCHRLTNGEHQSQITIQRSVDIKPRWRLSFFFPPLHAAFLNFHLYAIFTDFKEMTQTICVSHPHAAHAWTLTPHSTHTRAAKAKKMQLTQWHRHKCLHMQESKNSLRSGIKNRLLGRVVVVWGEAGE